MSSKTDLSTLVNRNRAYLPAAAAVSISITLIFLAVSSVFTILDTRSELLAVEQTNESLENRVIKLRSLQEGELSQIETVVNAALPNEKPIFNALRAVNDLADETGIFLSELESSPGSVASSSGKVLVNPQASSRNNALFERINIDLEIKGELSAINDFLDSILQVSPLMELKTVRISFGNAQGEEKLFSSEIELEIYWKPPKQSSNSKISPTSQIQDLSEKQIEIIETASRLRSF